MRSVELLILFGLVGSTATSSHAATAGWLTASGEARGRYESLDGQYRAGRSGSDQILALRSLLKLEAKTKPADFVLELQDARVYLDDQGTPLSTSFVNTLDILQAYAEFGGDNHALRLGRFTLDIGSRRFAERNDFRNTINAFTGLHWRADWQERNLLEAFYTTPVEPRPEDRRKLAGNDFELDGQLDNRYFWGLHYQRRQLPAQFQGEVFLYGLREEDRRAQPTPDRELWIPGLRLWRKPAAGALDLDLETAAQLGTRRATAEQADPRKLDVRAYMLHLEVGYTFDHSWNPRIGLEFDLASGDGDPGDGDYERYENFYGSRRGDLGNTSLHGPLTRSNVSIPGVRVSFRKDRWDGRAHFQWAYLEEAADSWVPANLKDPTGVSGRFIGHTLDGRIRYWLQPGRFRLELGGSILWFGDFARSVPGGPEGQRTLFGYTQITASFR